MYKKTVVCKNPRGIHNRPAVYIIKLASQFKCSMYFTAREITVAPKITQKTSVGANDAQYELTGLTNAGDNTFAFVTKTVKNVKITVPKTGGMGTTLFTICGASLIVLAGVMFVVLKRKKTSK